MSPLTMSLDSDVKINVSRFSPSSIPEEVDSQNRQIRDICATEQKWYEVNYLAPGGEVFATPYSTVRALILFFFPFLLHE
jgi:hypothetical protein